MNRLMFFAATLFSVCVCAMNSTENRQVLSDISDPDYNALVRIERTLDDFHYIGRSSHDLNYLMASLAFKNAVQKKKAVVNLTVGAIAILVDAQLSDRFGNINPEAIRVWRKYKDK